MPAGLRGSPSWWTGTGTGYIIFFSGGSVNRVTVLLETSRRDGKLIYKITGAGDPFPVLSGMLCYGEAVVERQVPITLVIPALKKWFGLTEM